MAASDARMVDQLAALIESGGMDDYLAQIKAAVATREADLA